MNPHDTNLVPSVQDTHGDARTRVRGMPDDAAEFLAAVYAAEEPELSPEEEAEMEAQYMLDKARRDAEAAEDDRRAAECVEAFTPMARAAAAVKRAMAAAK